MKMVPLGCFRAHDVAKPEARGARGRHRLLGCVLVAMLLPGAGAGCAHTDRGAKGQGAVLSLEVAGEDGELAEDADVFVDGQYVGALGEVRDSVRLAPGTHRVEVRRTGSFPMQQTVKVESSRVEVRQTVRGNLLPDPLD